MSIKIIWKAKELQEGDLLDGASIRVSLNDEGADADYRSYESDHIEITVHKDGALHFSADDAETQIYFYPDQLEHVARALKVAQAQAQRGEGAK